MGWPYFKVEEVVLSVIVIEQFYEMSTTLASIEASLQRHVEVEGRADPLLVELIFAGSLHIAGLQLQWRFPPLSLLGL